MAINNKYRFYQGYGCSGNWSLVKFCVDKLINHFGTNSEEHRERFYQDLKMMDESYQCWPLKRHCQLKNYKRNANKRSFIEISLFSSMYRYFAKQNILNINVILFQGFGFFLKSK